MKTVLCIEDHEDYQFLIPRVLKEFNTLVAPTLAQARAFLANEKIDLILLDVSLPDGDGLKFFSMLKSDEETKNIPVIVLSSAADITNKVLAFNLGAEDYICKPVDPTELKARVSARIRRLDENSPKNSQLRLENLLIDFDAQRAYIQNEKSAELIELTPKEFRILKLMSLNYGNVLSRDTLLDKVWGTGVNVVDRTIDAHMSNLRKKIHDCRLSIDSVIGEGYRLSRSLEGKG